MQIPQVCPTGGVVLPPGPLDAGPLALLDSAIDLKYSNV
jgi:hypothetical protein